MEADGVRWDKINNLLKRKFRRMDVLPSILPISSKVLTDNFY